jgi:hypothetical protein
MLVKTFPGMKCPTEHDPRSYITDIPVEVPDTTYYKRLIRDGSLMEVAVEAPKDKTSKKAAPKGPAEEGGKE